MPASGIKTALVIISRELPAIMVLDITVRNVSALTGRQIRFAMKRPIKLSRCFKIEN